MVAGVVSAAAGLDSAGEAAGLAAGATVSVDCSHAASTAATANRQMYLFID